MFSLTNRAAGARREDVNKRLQVIILAILVLVRYLGSYMYVCIILPYA